MLKESCPSQPLEWRTCTRREKGACSDVIRFNPSDNHASICLGGTASRVKSVRELTEWTWALTTLL